MWVGGSAHHNPARTRIACGLSELNPFWPIITKKKIPNPTRLEPVVSRVDSRVPAHIDISNSKYLQTHGKKLKLKLFY